MDVPSGRACTKQRVRGGRDAQREGPQPEVRQLGINRLAMPAAGGALVGAAEERKRRPQQDLQVDERRTVLDIPDVQLDPLVPWERCAAVDLRPAGQPGLDLEPAALALAVLLDLVGERR